MTPNTSSPIADLPSYLRDSTRSAHQDAESRPLNRALARATLPLPAWVVNLEQHLLLHRALERRLETVAERHPSWRPMIEGRRRSPDLEADLAHWAGNQAPGPGPAVTAAVAALDSADDHAVLGMLYVSEGSTNGGRFLTRCAARAWHLDPAGRAGLRTLDPYGEAQPARWADFKTALAALDLTAEARERVREGALAMFGVVAAVADETWAATPGPAA
jgi:heme oxygenase